MLTRQEKASRIKQWLNSTVLDSDVVKRTLNVDSGSLNAQVLLEASRKLIKLNRREVEPDDRDNLRYSKFLGIEDFVEEHILKDAARIQQKAAQKMQAKKNLQWLTPGFFTQQVRSVVIGNSLSQNVEGINPLEHFDNSHRVSKMGQGGIPSREAFPDESRQVNTSSFGFFDPVHIMEGDPGAANYLCHNVAKGRDQKLYRIMRDSKDGKLKWFTHEEVLDKQVKVPEH